MRNSEATIFLNEYDLNEADMVLAAYADNPHLRGEVAKPFSNRLESRFGIVEVGLQRLRESLSEKDFQRHIEPLERITISGKKALLITRNEMQRTLLERDFIPQIAKAFEVDFVRVVAQR